MDERKRALLTRLDEFLRAEHAVVSWRNALDSGLSLSLESSPVGAGDNEAEMNLVVNRLSALLEDWEQHIVLVAEAIEQLRVDPSDPIVALARNWSEWNVKRHISDNVVEGSPREIEEISRDLTVAWIRWMRQYSNEMACMGMGLSPEAREIIASREAAALEEFGPIDCSSST
ncbi:MAG: hypothetical protein U0324_14870 [Polyangiales bacterium]